MKNSSDISQSSVSSRVEKPPKSFTLSSSTITVIVAIIVVGALAFWGGYALGKHNSTTRPSTSAFGGSGFRGGGFRGGGFGTVTAISSTSITVQNNRTNASKTFTITSSTKITNNGSSTTSSAIADGDTVVVIPSSSDASEAASIIVNPSFGGGFGGGGGGGSSSSTGL